MTDTYFTEDFFWDDPISFDAVTCVYTDTPAVCELDNYQHISNVVTIP